MFPARKAKASLIKEGNYSAARALDLIVTGAFHDPPIPLDGPGSLEHMCNRCNWSVPATRKHCLLECPGNDLIDHPHMHKTQWVKRKGLSEWDMFACLYARGIVPSSFIKQPNEVEYLSAKVWASSNFDQVLAQTGRAYSDGSGGPKDVPRNVSQVSFGAACFDFLLDGPHDFVVSNLEVIGGLVPGKQTVPRAELWGGIQVLVRLPSNVEAFLGLDASCVTKGARTRGKLIQGTNGDLWSILYRLIDTRIAPTNVFKVKSHLDEEGPTAVTSGRINMLDLTGKSLADAVAEKVGKMLKPDHNIIASANRADISGFLVAKRLAIIQADI